MSASIMENSQTKSGTVFQRESIPQLCQIIEHLSRPGTTWTLKKLKISKSQENTCFPSYSARIATGIERCWSTVSVYRRERSLTMQTKDKSKQRYWVAQMGLYNGTPKFYMRVSIWSCREIGYFDVFRLDKVYRV